MKMSNGKLFAAAALAMAFGGVANAATWIGPAAGGEYSTAANWDDGLVPATNSTQTINGGNTVERTVDSVAGRTFIEGGATLNVTSGNHNDSRSGNTIRNFVGRGSAGTVNLSGGSYEIGHSLSIGGGNASGDGKVFVSGGLLSAYRGANQANGLAIPSVSIEIGGSAAQGGAGLLEISGGAISTRVSLGIGANGTFSVVGSAATSIGIGSNGSLDGGWYQEAGGTLSFAADAGGVTTILIDDVDGGGVSNGVLFEALAELDLSLAGPAPLVTTTYTLMEAENTAITDSGLVLSAATDAFDGTSGWSFAVDNSGANGLLTATYTVIPEPGSIGLLATGGILMLARRRRK